MALRGQLKTQLPPGHKSEKNGGLQRPYPEAGRSGTDGMIKKTPELLSSYGMIGIGR
jgi:hypothetical protein